KLDGDDVVLNTGADSAKGKALRRDPRVCLSVDDQRPPCSFVVIDGAAEISEDMGRRHRRPLHGRRPCGRG
ncbi:MAG TPA: pyridoxamine 5'-phosphate oxidase family protein, partial [Streptosporangiaceae bacterium]|nr:pyridoxamine 5'-phosphate oxidase family protein [Streptosporangiaceae bacterium]